MTAYVTNYSDIAEKEAFQKEMGANKEYGWLKDIPEPREPMDESPEAYNRYLIEQEELTKDNGEVRMFQLFAEGTEDLYTGLIDRFVRNTPALWDEFVMRLPSGEYYLVDPDPNMPTPTEPTAENLCLDIHNNVKFSPRLCLWAIEQKLESTGETFATGQFAEFCYNELKEYVEKRSELDDSFYKHLVINTQSRTFEDKNYVNTIGSKVVIKPAGEIFELSVKKNKTLQRTMVNPTPEQASSAMDDSGDLPTGEIPEESMEVDTGDLPSGEIPESQVAEPTEDLPTGEISVVEAKEEDVEMEEAKDDEEIPQDDQAQEGAQQAQEEEPDFGDDEEYPESELSEGALLRVNKLLNSEMYDLYGHDEDSDGEIQRVNPRPRVASRAQARFIRHMVAEDRERLENRFARERELREHFHRRSRELEQRREQANAAGNLPPGETPAVPSSSGGLPTGEIPDVPIEQETKEEETKEEQEVTQENDEEVKIYQEELQGRKDIDIFAQSPTAQFMELLKPEPEEQAAATQKILEIYS